ncbi:hypothetical protein, partial [Alistipes communis]|uniref:hypothetical protein n=1 Tax=Alistipes communis TaxID=2585118 RepID=UPI002430BC3F
IKCGLSGVIISITAKEMTGIRAIISLMKRYLILLGLILEYNQVFILYCAVQEWGILYLVQKSLHDFRLISKKIRSISFCR